MGESGGMTIRICLHGPESTGKSTLARQLASHFAEPLVPEYGRLWCESFGTDLTMHDLVAIAHGHDAMTTALEQCAKRLVIVDTDPLMTTVWADMLFGRRHPWFDRWGPPADLYIIPGLDLPWVEDGTRMFGKVTDRQRFMELSEAELVRRGARYVKVEGQGDARFANALAAIQSAGLPV